ncbi:MAG: 2-oxoglutarate dehydrogenase E1 component [Gammaproteobacteria bacterium]|nr:2-oxoglutarate dehydrogenase E1 component [Gammaproteobacteria bacterium]MDH5801668.1 2-oxoglutarate dehydrogenase E1 component [Gammaproteobacteria bacterium]
MRRFKNNSHLNSSNAPFVEELYAAYLKKPTSVSSEWQKYFQQLQSQDTEAPPDVDHQEIRDEFARINRDTRQPAAPLARMLSADAESKQIHVLQLINAYRFRGHQHAEFDPLHLNAKEHVPELELQHHSLSDLDLDMVFNTGSLMGPRQASLREILEILKQTYSGQIGVEYMHITDTEEKRWIQHRLESVCSTPKFSEAKQQRLLERVVAAGEFERYLHTRYVGQKRFSLEGAESLIPLMDELIQRAGGRHKVTEVVLGMAHRGRLNVLTNILGKAPNTLFMEFEGKVHSNGNGGSGDVKYHQGFSSDIQTESGIVHLALSFNPSHLEIIGPVVEGSTRARQNRRGDLSGSLVLPILVHGDAAFAGQGVVMETFQMSEARGYTTGGTVHIVVNNQIGFTTSNPLDARSTVYCTEVARMVQAPIFHVNGDDPEAVVFAAQLALDFRMRFQKDVVLDMVCYRRHGHSEADEPSATQPMMYKQIKAHPPVAQLYAESLVQKSGVDPHLVDQIKKEYREALEHGECVAPNIITGTFDKPYWVDWKPYLQANDFQQVDTSLSAEDVRRLMFKSCEVPEDISVHTQVSRIFKSRRQMAQGEIPMDWGFAETLAYASLLQSGFPVRISGQDCGRGTFFHRHAVVHDQKDGSAYIPLQFLSEEQAHFTIIDSLLSEEAVLAFEYGYSTAAPYSLVIWEAQFGDFANGAQVVIDQFISSGESKWGRLSGLVMFLPHGFDGQGPEHSSARLERYLQLCAEDNMQVIVPTVPAQIFHALRQQMLSNVRKPLVVMSPKSLLRHKYSVSALEDVCEGGFRAVIPEVDEIQAAQVNKVVLCSGKVYFDLLDARRERGINKVAIVRLERLYPFPQQELEQCLQHYPNAVDIVWCQEEPKNQGAWYYIQSLLLKMTKPNQTLQVTARPASASPAVGYYQKHIDQLHELINDALGLSEVQMVNTSNVKTSN